MEKPKHIFIVEDNELYSMMLDYILTKDSIYQFVRFNSGEECIKNLYLNPDIIILDYGLPGLNGYETLLAIKKHNSHTHVIILSNNTDNKIKKKLLKAGADDFVLKQDHGETQIIEKIESLLFNDELESENLLTTKNKSFMMKMFIAILILSALVLGYIHLNIN
jgi:DNA-binding NarL/FixJ family response regulator